MGQVQCCGCFARAPNDSFISDEWGSPNRSKKETRNWLMQLNDKFIIEIAGQKYEVDPKTGNRTLITDDYGKRREQCNLKFEEMIAPSLTMDTIRLRSQKDLPSTIKRGISNETTNMGNDTNNRQKLQLSRVESALRKRVLKQHKDEDKNCDAHIAYLYASPLVFKYEINDRESFIEEHLLDHLSFREEKAIIENLRTAQKEIKYIHLLATYKNLGQCLSRKIFGIHFSGHGLVNNSQSYKSSFNKMTQLAYNKMLDKKGDVLVFEEDYGGASWFCTESELKKILAQYYTDLKFVVVASCHSEQCGKIFRAAKAKHVICIDKNSVVNDQAATDFANVFYSELFTSKITICDAFHHALDVVRNNYKKQEAQKFILLTEEGQTGHTCGKEFIIYNFLKAGEVQNYYQDECNILLVPANINPWIQRLDVYNVVSQLAFGQQRIIQIGGEFGSGKSAIVSRVTNFLADRNIYKGGIIYVNFSGIKSIDDALQYLAHKIYMVFRKQQKVKKISSSSILDKIFKYFDNRQKVLFVIDNLDRLNSHDGEEIKNLLQTLICEQDNLSIIISSQTYIMNLDGIYYWKTGSLKEDKATKLFISKVKQKVDFNQNSQKDVFSKLNEITNRYSQLLKNHLNQVKDPQQLKVIPCIQECKRHKNKEECYENNLSKLPMFKILKYPLQICMAASQAVVKPITLIYDNILKELQEKESVQIKVDQVIEIIQQQFPFADELINLMSLAVTGLSMLDIKSLYKNIDEREVEQLINHLVNSSILQAEDNEKQQQRFKVQNFVLDQLANSQEENIDEEICNEIKFNKKLIDFMQARINSLKIQASNDYITLDQLFNQINQDQLNILHLIKNQTFNYEKLGKNTEVTLIIQEVTSENFSSRINNKEQEEEKKSEQKTRGKRKQGSSNEDGYYAEEDNMEGDISQDSQELQEIPLDQIDVNLRQEKHNKKIKYRIQYRSEVYEMKQLYEDTIQLLFNLLSVLAVQGEDLQEFLEIKEMFTEDEEYLELRSNIELMEIYFNLQLGNYDNVIEKVELMKIFNPKILENKNHRAIANYILAYLQLAKLNNDNDYRMIKSYIKAINQEFQEINNLEGMICCKELLKELKHLQQTNAFNKNISQSNKAQKPQQIFEKILLTKSSRSNTNLFLKFALQKQSQKPLKLQILDKKLLSSLSVNDPKKEFELQKQMKTKIYSSLHDQDFLLPQNYNNDQNQIHFAYLFASPLVYEDQRASDAKQQRKIWRIFSNIKQQGFIFQGILKNKGDVLLFEDYERIGAHYFCSESDLTSLQADSKTILKFVVVHTKNSERCGQIFLNIQTEHVICIERENDQSEMTENQFAEIFYQLLLMKKYTIQEAFKEAKDTILRDQWSINAHIYKLLVQNNHKCTQDCIISNKFSEGNPNNLDIKSLMRILPPQPNQYLPRKHYTYQILQKLHYQKVRILQVFGQSGVGKSALVANALHYMAQRNLYKGAIIHLNFATVHSLRDALDKIEQKYIQQEQMMKEYVQQTIKDNTQQLFKNQDFKMLLALDNVDQLIIKHRDQFIELLNYYTNNFENLQIVITTSNFVSVMQSSFLYIKPLKSKQASSLFISMISQTSSSSIFNDRKNIEKLIQLTKLKKYEIIRTFKPLCPLDLQREIDQLKLCELKCQKHQNINNGCAISLLRGHPMFQLLTRPLYICLAAQLLNTHSLNELFSLLLECNDSQEAEILLLDQSIKISALQSDIANDIIMLISQAPDGLTIQNIQELFPDQQASQVQKIVEIICQSALLTKDNTVDDHSNCIYRLQNFISHLIEIMVLNNPQQMIKYKRMLVSYYQDSIIRLGQFSKLMQGKDFIDKAQDTKGEYGCYIKFLQIARANILSSIKYLVQQKYGPKNCSMLDSIKIAEHFKNKQQQSYQKGISKQYLTKRETEFLSNSDQFQQYTTLMFPPNQSTQNRPKFNKNDRKINDFQDKQQIEENDKIFERKLFFKKERFQDKLTKSILSDKIDEISKYNDQIQKYQNLLKTRFNETNNLLSPSAFIDKYIQQHSKSVRSQNSQSRQQIESNQLENTDKPIPSQLIILVEPFDEKDEVKSVESRGSFTEIDQIEEEQYPQSQQVDDDSYYDDAKYLLFHYLAIIAVINDDQNQKFKDTLEVFQVMKQDVTFEANVKMIQIYQEINQKNYKSALQKLQDLSSIFSANECIIGQAICNYFQARLHWDHFREEREITEIETQLEFAQDRFFEASDFEAINYCQNLRTLIKEYILKEGLSGQIDNSQSEEIKTIFQRQSMVEDKVSGISRIKFNKEQEDLNMLLNYIDFEVKQ